MIAKFAAAATLALGLSSCAFFRLATSEKFKAPTFAFVRCDVKSVEARQANVDFILSSYNPNDVGLKNVSVDYELFSEGKRFLRGNDVRVDLAPKDTSPIVIPAQIVYSDVIGAAGPAAEKILLGKRSLPVRVDAVLSGNPTLYSKTQQGSLITFSIKVSRTVDIPVPEKQIDKTLDRAKGELLRRF